MYGKGALADGVVIGHTDLDILIEGPHSVLGPMATMVGWKIRINFRQMVSSLPRPKQIVADSEVDLSETGFTHAAVAAYAPVSRWILPDCMPVKRAKTLLPNYPFQRERYWLEQSRRKAPSDAHPLLGVKTRSAVANCYLRPSCLPMSELADGSSSVWSRACAGRALCFDGIGCGFRAQGLAQNSGQEPAKGLVNCTNAIACAFDPSVEGGGEHWQLVQLILSEAAVDGARSFKIYSRGEQEEDLGCMLRGN